MNKISAGYISVLFVVCMILSSLMLSGCAVSSTTIIDEEVITNPKPMYNYKSLVIKNLELKREMYSDASESQMSKREMQYSKLPAELSSHIEKYVNSRTIYNTVSRDSKLDASTLLLTGEFTRLGRFKISIHIVLADGLTGQMVASFRQTLWDVTDTTASISDLGRDVAEFLYRIQYK